MTSNTSLFTYNPGENTTTFANKSFTPIFLDEDLIGNNTELRKKAEETCQGDVNCLFDIASTGDTSVGESTKQVSVQLESESQELRKYTKVFRSNEMITFIINNCPVKSYGRSPDS